MDTYGELSVEAVRSEPDVWVSRIVIFERLTPDPKIIRDVALTRGLNIIWAEEAEDDDSTAEITGHSAGKTTLCRLIRYALGERTFGTKGTMELVRKAFPDGYVAAELHVCGQSWSIRRPFGSGRMSFIREQCCIEELLEERGRSVTQESYAREIGLETFLGEPESGGIARTGGPIQWAHILAWCTRDQETRYQNIHDWRSPRSEADTPSFRFPKSDPLAAMRTVLGLFLPDELKGEERLAELQRGKDRLTKDIDDRRREPQFRVNLYESQLRRSLQNLLPNEPDIDLLPFRSGDLFIEDLERLTTTTLKALERSLDINEQEHQTLQAQIDSLGVELRDQENALAELETLFALDAAAGQELDVGLSKNEEERNKIEQFKHRKCPFGDVLIRNCAHVQDRQRILQIAKLQDAHAIEQAEVRRGEERRKIAEWKVDLRKEMERIKKEQQDALERRKALVVHASAQRDSARDLERTRNGLVIWMQKRDGSGGYEELDLLRRKLDATEIEIAKVENELAKLLRQHDENRERLAAIFSWAVRSVLSFSGYDGRVSLENRELAFSITHGPAMSGEAVESLAVLLADIACLVYNMVSGRSHLPGFLMHDSPREADLGIKIYRSFLRFAASLQALLGGLESCSFQYVLTTTTPPPKELQTKEYVKLQLNASRPEGLLFRRNIAQARLDDLSSGGDPL